MKKVDINIINDVFISSTIEVYKQLIGSDIVLQNIEQASDEYKIFVNLASVIGFTGTIKGQIIMVVDEPLAFKITSAILMGMEINEYNEMVASSVCEMINMIAGETARQLTEKGFNIEVSVPSLINGQNVEIFLQRNVPVHLFNFSTQYGKLELYICIT